MAVPEHHVFSRFPVWRLSSAAVVEHKEASETRNQDQLNMTEIAPVAVLGIACHVSTLSQNAMASVWTAASIEAGGTVADVARRHWME